MAIKPNGNAVERLQKGKLPLYPLKEEGARVGATCHAAFRLLSILFFVISAKECHLCPRSGAGIHSSPACHSRKFQSGAEKFIEKPFNGSSIRLNALFLARLMFKF